MNSSWMNPSSFTMSLPSSPAEFTPSESNHSGSPAPSTFDDDNAHAAGPSRKRARTDASADERKEARAHRNRIAAQNSRDKRKAQFSQLQQRVAELEDENRQLRAGAFVPAPLSQPGSSTSHHAERAVWERENAELRERIKTLETGWNAILKALQAQGLGAAAMSIAAASSAPPPLPTHAAPAPSAAAPISPRTTTTATSSHASPSPVFTMPNPSPRPRTPTLATPAESPESARHPARVATAAFTPNAASQQRADRTLLSRPLASARRLNSTKRSAWTADIEQAWTRTLRRLRPGSRTPTSARRWTRSSPRSSRPRPSSHLRRSTARRP